MYHRTIIVGRAGNAPTMRYTPDGTPVTSLSVAVNTGYGDKQGSVVSRVLGKYAEGGESSMWKRC